MQRTQDMNEQTNSNTASQHTEAQPSQPSAAFETYLHHQESRSSVGGMSSGEFELGLFRIDSGNDDDLEGGQSLEMEGSQHACTGAKANGDDDKDKWRGSLPLYNTSVDVDYTEATIVAPVDLDEGNILRVDMGMRRILVVQVPKGGIKSGEKFTAPYQIHHTPLSELEAFRAKAYNNGHYHGWIVKLFGFCEAESRDDCLAVCCPCVLLSRVMSRMHLNCWGKRISSISPSTQQRRRRCTMTCVVMLYTSAFILTVLLILHMTQAIFCLEFGSLFAQSESIDEVDEPMIREEEAEEIGINSLDGVETCDYRINKAYLTSILALDALLWGYTVMLVSRARTAIREHHYIHGRQIEDCCVSCCCNCCALSQLARETSYEDHGTRRLSNVDVSIGERDDFLNESNKEGQHCYRPVFT